MYCVRRYRATRASSYTGEDRSRGVRTGGFPETKEWRETRHACTKDAETCETWGEIQTGLSQTVQWENGWQADGARLAEESESLRGTWRPKGVFLVVTVLVFQCESVSGLCDWVSIHVEIHTNCSVDCILLVLWAWINCKKYAHHCR